MAFPRFGPSPGPSSELSVSRTAQVFGILSYLFLNLAMTFLNKAVLARASGKLFFLLSVSTETNKPVLAGGSVLAGTASGLNPFLVLPEPFVSV